MRRLTGDRLLVATHNAGKLAEIAAMLAPHGIHCVGAAEMGLAVPEETETTFAGNALIKAHAAAQATGLPALADDSGLEVEALGGAPGVLTADWAETPAGRDFGMAMARVRRELEGAEAPWRATFRTVLALAWPDGNAQIFEGSVAGAIVWPGRGADGHGYDPIFLPDGHALTFAEMDAAAKNLISHRAAAFREFLKECLP